MTEHRAELWILGIPVHFTTNDPIILERIHDAFGHWPHTNDTRDHVRPAQMRIFLKAGDEGRGEPQITYTTPDALHWAFETPGSSGMADLATQSGVAQVTKELRDDVTRFRVSVLHFLVLITITVQDRTPFHAAIIAIGNSGLLLAGPSGVGKSTLAYAATKAGFSLISDDAAYVQLNQHRVWGGGSTALLLDDAATRYPELRGAESAIFPTGKRKLMAKVSAAATPWIERVAICLLSRTPGPVSLQRVTREEIFDSIVTDQPHAQARFGNRLEESARWLASKGGWRLSLSSNPTEAVPSLELMLRELA